MAKLCYVWILLVSVVLPYTLAQVAEEDVDDKCIVDDSLPWDAEGNYMDCDTEENQQTGNTDCCEQSGGTIGCCNKGDQWKEMKKIAIGVGVGTFCVCVIVFLVVWCNPKTFPCLNTCKQRVKDKYERFEEKSGCCKSRVEKRRLAKQQENIPQYEVPEEMKADVKDDFFYLNTY